ncbi:MAG: zinc ribbon domain-containing protein [Gammaproteobacteria bacterium]|nr:zinc ribbon domain-containing protein [Gammaproteobacteria bacterium]MBU0787754.1 zinc ribbon domain-containing protein [Gammaproteobacteria bacterium]MBU0814776.1 zinc ribbon domain-containing protein [Gammaproteobacteria bacterium]MBU1786116.1 zinc ribbon domain-containing protein [Gammaproteobacteria bacterium]
MPTYDYACSRCGGFDAFRSLATRNEPAACPECGGAAPRVLASAPRLALMEGGIRQALETNERARHEPKRSGDYARLKHPAGCGCCSSGKRGATVTAPNGNKAFPSKRPWMISH